MEFKVEDIKEFMSSDELPSSGKFGKKFRGHIPANNSYGLEEMDVTIEVSHHLQGPKSGDLLKQFQNELKLRHLHHKNIIRLIGFASSLEHLYLVYEWIRGSSLTDIMEDLSWVNMLKVLKGIAAGLSYLHSQPMGPYVLCNLSPDNILISEDLFVPKIVNFKHCVREGDVHIGGTPGYYSEKNEGIAKRKDDVLAVGVLAVQLVTKDRRTAFTVKQDSVVEVKHILDVYVPQYKDGVDIAHPSYGRHLEARKLTEMVIGCLRKESRVDIAVFWREVVLLTMARQLVSS